jgi:hypothetical protein
LLRDDATLANRQKNMTRRIGIFVKSKVEDSSSAILVVLKVA